MHILPKKIKNVMKINFWIFAFDFGKVECKNFIRLKIEIIYLYHMSLYQCIRQLVNSNFKLLRNLWMNFSFCLTRQNIEQKIPWSKNWLWPCYAIDTTYILLCWSLKSLLNIYFLAFKCFTRVCRYIFNSFSEELKKKLWITNCNLQFHS